MMRRLIWAVLLGPATLVPNPAQAVAGRTFVSTTGVDTNTSVNCGPTAPCRTFSAALSVTGSGGEVVVLNSGGYGPPFAIAQSVSIAAPDGVYAGLTVGTGVGITIATAGISVALKGISINGTGGTYGISMTSGASLTVVNSVISGFSGASDAGIFVSTPAQVRLVNVIVRDNFSGITLDNGASATISHCQVLGNSATGINLANSGAGANTTTIALINDVVVNDNGTGVAAAGVSATATAFAYATSVVASGNSSNGYEASANGTVVVAGSVAMRSGQYGFLNNGGTFDSAGNNILSGNGTAPTSGTITAGGLTF
jgi:hypothetical protein